MSAADRQVIEDLIHALWDKDEEIRNQAIMALAELGQSAVPALLVALKNDDHSSEARGWENQHLREAIVQVGEPAFHALVAALQPDSHMVRAAAKTLPLFKDLRAVQPLIAALVDEQLNVLDKCYVIEALGELKAPGVSSYLIDALFDKSGYIRTSAAEALAQYADPSVIPLIFATLLRLPDIDQAIYRMDMLFVLARFGEHARKYAREALWNPDPEMRAVAWELINLLESLGYSAKIRTIPFAEASLTLLSEAESGRKAPIDLNDESAAYRPHIVIGSSAQRKVVVAHGNLIDEEYLGVQFHHTSVILRPGETALVRMDLIYHPAPAYQKVIPGAEFTLREGGQIIGYGVIRRVESNESEHN